jgi:hypothetical protein
MNTVYVVIKGYWHEGYTESDMKVFAEKADAVEYAKSLEADDYTYASIFEQSIH